jgi:EamA domain-containing membrane protein RarD
MNDEHKIATIRAITRSLGLLIPLTSLCLGMFFTTESLKEFCIGGVVGALSTAGIFYFEGKT